MEIRPERPNDVLAIRAVNESAFETSTEANLVDLLRAQAELFVSLVAIQDTSIVGHILFSPVTLAGRPDLRLMGLAPMAVLRGFERRGVGSALVRAGLNVCRDLGCIGVVVLGHADFYPRFGFTPASRFGIRCEYDVPDEVFMAIELEPGSLEGKSGTVQYHPAFGAV